MITGRGKMGPREKYEEGEDVDADSEGSDVESLTSYVRRPEHEQWLARVFKMTEVQLLAALAIEKYSQPGYVPSEVLVTLARNNYGGRARVRDEIALTLNKRLVSELGLFFHREINWLGVLNSSNVSREEAVAYVRLKIFGSSVDVSFAEVSFGPFVKMRLLDWFKSQIALKNSAPSVDAMAAESDEDGSTLSLIDQVEDEFALTPEQALEQKQLMSKCRTAILALPERQRTAMTLVYLQNMTHKEAGSVMGLTESSVQKHVQKALLTLQKGDWHVQ